MYEWGYLKSVILAKLDLDADEANLLGYFDRFIYYTNEAITQICSTVKPNRTFYNVEIHNGKYDGEGNYLESNLCVPITMPEDFISFGDDVNTIDEDIGYGDRLIRNCTDEDFRYLGYNKIVFYNEGIYNISYNARWFILDLNISDEDTLDAPIDVLECIPSYVASQCMKVDDDYKSSVFRNEFETLMARIDDTDFKSNKTFTIGGDW